MQNIRFLALLILVFSTASTSYAHSFTFAKIAAEQQNIPDLFEDITEGSPAWLSVTAEVVKSRLPFIPVAFLPENTYKGFSKAKAYYAGSRFLEPGLSLQDIIFPFHTFL